LEGLKTQEYPFEATDIIQVVDLTWQLRGKVGKRQVKNIKTCIIWNFGGFGNYNI